MSAGEKPTLTVERVAERLGVKKETVYAYVSRGLLTSRRSADGRSSLFDAGQVERLAGKRRPVAPGGTGLTIETALTLIEDQRPYYRGFAVTELARKESFEAVAELLWTGVRAAGAEVSCAEPVRAAVTGAVAALPASAEPMDRLRIAVAAASAADPFRHDLRAERVPATGRTLLAAMVEGLRPPGAAEDGSGTVASRLAAGLGADPYAPGVVRAVNAALVLLADHDLAASTLAARVAASTGADPYAVVLAALGAIDGPRHGAASRLPYALFADVADGMSAARALASRLRDGTQPPGFGHFLYPDGDPRAETLLAILDAHGGDSARLAVVAEVRAVAATRAWLPNIDFALAALAFVMGLAAEAGEAIFAVGRTAGWLAHAVEEYAVPFGRFRPRGRYVGVSPRTDGPDRVDGPGSS